MKTLEYNGIEFPMGVLVNGAINGEPMIGMLNWDPQKEMYHFCQNNRAGAGFEHQLGWEYSWSFTNLGNKLTEGVELFSIAEEDVEFDTSKYHPNKLIVELKSPNLSFKYHTYFSLSLKISFPDPTNRDTVYMTGFNIRLNSNYNQLSDEIKGGIFLDIRHRLLSMFNNGIIIVSDHLKHVKMLENELKFYRVNTWRNEDGEIKHLLILADV